MEVDTGSGVTLLNKRDFQKISDVESLQPSILILRGYTGNQITCLGEKSMKVEINSIQFNFIFSHKKLHIITNYIDCQHINIL